MTGQDRYLKIEVNKDGYKVVVLCTDFKKNAKHIIIQKRWARGVGYQVRR